MDFIASVQPHVPELFIDFNLLIKNQEQIISILDIPQVPQDHHLSVWILERRMTSCQQWVKIMFLFKRYTSNGVTLSS